MAETSAPQDPQGRVGDPEGPPLAVIASVNVGTVRIQRLPPAFPEAGLVGPYRTAIRKTPVAGPVAVTPTGLAGDAQADPANHGGPDKAVHAYFAQHLERWGAERGWVVAPGEIGENLLLAALPGEPPPDETSFCIGDILRAGTALLQVSQPRIPCHKQAGALELVDAVRRVAATGRCGFYLRVLSAGTVRAGDGLVLVDRPDVRVTVADAHRFVHQARMDSDLRARLRAVPALGADIRRRLAD